MRVPPGYRQTSSVQHHGTFTTSPALQLRRLTPMRSRPVPVTVAAILLTLCSLLSLPGPLLPGSDGVPEVVLYSGIVLGIVGLVAAVGLWMLKRVEPVAHHSCFSAEH